MEREQVEEIFLPIPIEGFDGSYHVSNCGRVISYKLNDPAIMRASDSKGYERINFSLSDKRRAYYVHVLVALTFIPNPEGLPKVNHIDGNKKHNNVLNLEWISDRDNSIHAREELGKVPDTIPVKQLDLQGNLIAIHPSIKEASERTGIQRSNIGAACNNRYKQSGGFGWEYVIDRKEPAPEGKEHPDFPNYIVTSGGRIYSKRYQRYMTPRDKDGKDYPSVELSGPVIKKKFFYVHTLVATLYLERKEEQTQVNHIDRNKSNADVSNLEWVTQSENIKHAHATGVKVACKTVIMYDMQWNELRRFDKMVDASAFVKRSADAVGKACRGVQESCAGYRWKYAKDVENQ